MTTLYSYNVLYPFAATIDSDTFDNAIKNFVTMHRNLNITRLIMADRFKNTMRADIAYRIKDNDLYAGISVTPTVYPSFRPTSPNRFGGPTQLLGLPSKPGDPLQPYGIRNTSDGQQVFPISKDNVAIGGIKGNFAYGIGGMPIYPSLAHQRITPYPGYFFNKKNAQKKFYKY